jgi:hypothetical protein
MSHRTVYYQVPLVSQACWIHCRCPCKVFPQIETFKLSALWLVGVLVTHFLLGHHLSELSFPVIQRISVGLGRLKFFLFLFAEGLRSRAAVAAFRSSVGELCGRPKIASNFAFSHLFITRKIYFTCLKCTTWDSHLYFTSKGRCDADFIALKDPPTSAGSEPAKLPSSYYETTEIEHFKLSYTK